MDDEETAARGKREDALANKRAGENGKRRRRAGHRATEETSDLLKAWHLVEEAGGWHVWGLR